MANFIQNGGKWGPIDESGQKSYEGREIIIDFDNTETTSIMYTNPFGVAVSTETEFVWNTEAIDCANTADVQIRSVDLSQELQILSYYLDRPVLKAVK